MEKGTVLVVDDDPLIVGFLTEFLEGDGFRVHAAVGAGAPPLAREVLPDVVLLDIMMPGMDGVEVSHLLHADPATAQIPIIALSAGYNLRAHAGEMQANDYLSKPFDVDELLLRVEKWVAARHATGSHCVAAG
jgi:DNA-binding response OmpR family regulator